MALLLGAPVCAQSSLSLWVGRGAAFPVMPVRAPLAYSAGRHNNARCDSRSVGVGVPPVPAFVRILLPPPHSNTKASRRVHARTHRRATVAFCPSFTFESHCITIAGRRVHTRARTCTYPRRSPTPSFNTSKGSTTHPPCLHTLHCTPAQCLPQEPAPVLFLLSLFFVCPCSFPSGTGTLSRQ